MCRQKCVKPNPKYQSSPEVSQSRQKCRGQKKGNVWEARMASTSSSRSRSPRSGESEYRSDREITRTKVGCRKDIFNCQAPPEAQEPVQDSSAPAGRFPPTAARYAAAQKHFPKAVWSVQPDSVNGQPSTSSHPTFAYQQHLYQTHT